MPLFGKKKKDADIEEPEGEGLLMSRPGDEPGAQSPAAPPGSDAAPSEAASAEGAGEDELAASLDGQGAATLEADEDGGPSDLEAPGDLGSLEQEPEAQEGGEAASSDEAAAGGDLLAMFGTSETYGDLADLTRELDDIPAADLLAELREIRGTLPAEALEDGDQAA